MSCSQLDGASSNKTSETLSIQRSSAFRLVSEVKQVQGQREEAKDAIDRPEVISELPPTLVAIDLALATDKPDDSTIAFAVYMALCPRKSCGQGFALSDIHIEHPSTSGALVLVKCRSVPADEVAAALEAAVLRNSLQLRGVISQASAVHVLASPAVRHQELNVQFHSLSKAADRSNEDGVIDWAVETDQMTDWIDDELGERQEEPLDIAMVCGSVVAIHFMLIILMQVIVERLSRFSGCDMDEGNPYYTFWWTMMRMKLDASTAPVMCIIFLLVHVRTHRLTQAFGHPPAFVETFMVVTTAGTITISLLHVMSARIRGPPTLKSSGDIQEELDEEQDATVVRDFSEPLETDELDFEVAKDGSPIATFLTLVIHLLYVMLFLTITTCLFGLLYAVHTMTAADCIGEEKAKLLWADEPEPPYLEEVRVCWSLALQTLLIFKGHVVCIMVAELFLICGSQAGQFLKVVNNAFRFAKSTVRLLPMLCMVFLAAMLHHAQVEPVESHFTRFMKDFDNMAQIACPIYTVLVFTLACLPRQYRLRAAESGAMSHTFLLSHIPTTSRSRIIFVIFHTSRFVVVGFIITCFVLVSVSIVFIESDPSAGPSPAVSMALVWVIALSIQYVFFYCVLLMLVWECEAIAQSDNTRALMLLQSAMREIDDLVMLTPVTALLFIMTHMRAQEVASSGDPQGWALTAMNIVTQAMLLQQIIVLVECTVAQPLMLMPASGDIADSVSTSLGSVNMQSRLMNQARSFEGCWNTRSPDGICQVHNGECSFADNHVVGFFVDGTDRCELQDGQPLLGSLSPDGGSIIWDDGSEWVREGQTEEMDGTMSAGRMRSGFRRGSIPTMDMADEVAVLARRVLSLLMSCCQFGLLFIYCVCMAVIMAALFALDVDAPQGGTLIFADGDHSNNYFPPVSMSIVVKCIMHLVLLFFAWKGPAFLIESMSYVYASDRTESPLCIVAARVSELVEIAPVMGVLFLMACSRARELQVMNAMPAHRTQDHMVVATFLLVVNSVLVMVCSSVMGQLRQSGRKAPIHHCLSSMMFVVNMGFLLVLQFCAAVIILDIAMMTPESVVLPDGSSGKPWPHEGQPPALSKTLMAVWMSIFFFSGMKGFEQIITWYIQRLEDTEGGSRRHRRKWWDRNRDSAPFRLYYACLLSKESVSVAPALGVIYLVVEQHRMLYGFPSNWPENTVMTLICLSCVFMMLEALLLFVIGYLESPPSSRMPGSLGSAAAAADGTELDEPGIPDEGEKKLEQVLRLVAMVITICGAATTSCALFFLYQMEPALAKSYSTMEHTERVTFLTLHLVTAFVVMYSLWRIVSLLGADFELSTMLLDMLAVMPMLSVLFVTIRQRVFELAGPEGEVPGWIFAEMEVCALCLIVKFLATIMLPLVAVKADDQQKQALTDEAPAPRESGLTRCFRDVFVFLQFVALMALYGSILAVCMSCFSLTRETCLPATEVEL